MTSINLTRRSPGHYTLTNARGGSIDVGDSSNAEFAPVELLLAAVAACSSIDVDTVTSRRAEPTRFAVSASGDKHVDEAGGAILTDVTVRFDIAFGDDPAGAEAAAMIERLVALSHDKYCTVSRTLEAPTPVEFIVG
ncbi:MAG TPA: OsmC family protein [Propionibacteriaceae bacterium]|nr:OsmC family protein [Propionibacteriaceae bacterium]